MRDFSFRLEVDENCALLCYYAESSGNFCERLAQPIGPISRVLND
jgi:hypothetical protein